MNDSQSKKESYSQNHSPGELQKKSRPKMNNSSNDMFPAETLQCISSNRHSADDNYYAITLLQEKISVSHDVLVNNDTIHKHDMTNDVKSFNNHTESGATSTGNTCVSPIPFSSECLTVINKVVNDLSLPDNTFKFHSIINANETSLVHANDRSSHNPFPIESITTMQLSSLASINEDRGPSTSENIRNNSPNTVKLNTVNQPSNTSNPFHSPFHPLSSSDANGILEQTINAPTDRTTLDLTSEIPKKTPTVVKGGITITKEERSQRYTRSRSRSKSLQKITLSSQQLQKNNINNNKDLTTY